MYLEIPFSHYYYFNILRLLRRDTPEQALEFLFNNVSESSNDWLSIRYKHYLKKNKKIFFKKTPLNFTVQMFLKKIQGLPPEIRPFSDGPYSNDFKILSNNEHNILEFDNIKFYDYKKNRNKHRIIPIFNLVKDKFEIKFNNINEYGSYRDIGSQYYRLIKEKEVNFMPKQGQNAMDVGCYIGHRAIAMSKLVGSEGVVYAIEAEENNFNLLKKNIYENNLKNIIPISGAVDDFPKKTFIYSRQKNSMAHGLRKFENIEDPSAIDIENRTQYKKEIQTTTISEVMSNYKINCIDMMHISVTGHEYEVIKGIGSFNQKIKKIRVSCPYSNKGKLNIIISKNLLINLGYKILRIHGSAICAKLSLYQIIKSYIKKIYQSSIFSTFKNLKNKRNLFYHEGLSYIFFNRKNCLKIKHIND